MPEQTRQTVISQPPEQARGWYIGAVRLAVVAGVFCGVVAGFMIVQHIRLGMADPMDDQQFNDKIQQMRAEPKNEALKTQLEVLDKQLRDRYFLHRKQTNLGAWLLLGGMVVFVASAKLASSLRRRLPVVQPATPGSSFKQDELAWMRWGLLGMAVVTGGVMIGLGAGPGDPMTGWQQQVAAAQAAQSQNQTSDQQTKDAVDLGPLPDWTEYQKHWPRFRGPGGLGIAQPGKYPTHWDCWTGRNIKWKTPIDLPGYNSPVVWGDRIFLSGADQSQNKVYCFDAKTGEPLWASQVKSPNLDRAKLLEEIKVMKDTGHAPSTLATDGLRVYAVFVTGELAAFDFKGNLLWLRVLPIREVAYGYATSLTTYNDQLIVQLDRGQEEQKLSALLAIDGATGQDVWKQPRPVAGSWATPIIVRDEKAGDMIVTVAVDMAIAHDARTGRILWQVKGIGDDAAPSPVVGGAMVFVVSPSEALLAIKPGGSGDVTESHLAWENDESYYPDISSPLCDGQRVYLITTSGELICFSASDGKLLYEQFYDERVFNTSPSLADGHLYLIDLKGVSTVIKVGDKYEAIDKGELGEKNFASPAFVNGRIYLRTDGHLWCIEQGAQGPKSQPAPDEGDESQSKEQESDL